MKTKLLFYRNLAFAVMVLLMLAPGLGWGQVAGDYRSKATGNWNATTTWEKYDGAVWQAATATPTSADGTITIKSPNVVTISASGLTYDQVVVDFGAQVTVAATVTHTLANGTGTDLTINGTWLNSGGTWTVTGATWTVGSGGTFIHNTTSGIATPLGVATLNSASNFIYRGSSTLQTSIALSGRTYGNFTIESSSGTWTPSASAGAAALVINGSLNVGGTGAGTVLYNQSGATMATTVVGDISIKASCTYTPPTGTFTISGSITNAGTMTFNSSASLIFDGNTTLSGATLVSFANGFTVNANKTFANSQNGNIVPAGKTATINGTFQVNQGSWTGTTGTYTYGAAGTLIFNNTSGPYGSIDNTHLYWPASNGPFNVTVQNGGGITMGVARTVGGKFLLVSGTNAVQGTALTLNGTVQINGGNFQATPTYGASSTLIYNTTYGTSNEWTAGASNTVAAGSGIPANVTVQTGTLTLGGGRGIPGNLTIASGAGLILNATSGDLYIGGNLSNSGSTWTNNTRAVFFVLGNTQTITSTSNPQYFDYLVLDKTGGSVQLNSTNVSVNTASGNVVQILNSGSLDLNGYTLALNNSGGGIYVNGASTITSTATGGKLDINQYKFVANNAGTGSLLIGANVTVNMNVNGNFDFGKSGSTYITTLNGTLSINSTTSCFVNTNPPIYGSGAKLVYNSGGSYGRGLEWSSAGGAGYPYNLQISGNTTLNVNNGANVFRQIAGNLTVDIGSTFSMESMSIADPTVIGVTVTGDVTNNGTVTLGSSTERLKCTNYYNSNTTTLSSNVGGDLELTGSLIDNSTFNANFRAVFFTGSGVQDVSGSGTFNIDYIVMTKSTGSVRMLNDLLCEGPNGGHAISFSSSSCILDLNGHLLTLGKASVSSDVLGSGYFKGSNTSSISILGTGALGSVNFDQTTPGTTNVLQNLTINRTSSGSVTLGNSLTVSSALTLTDGVLAAGTNTLTLNGTVTNTSGVLTSASGGTISYNQSTAGQSVLAMDYSNLTFSAYTKVLPSGTIRVSGTFSGGTSAGNTLTGNTFEFNGSSSQTLPSGFAIYNNLTVNNTAGVVLPSSLVTVNSTLLINSGTKLQIGTASSLTVDGTLTNSAGDAGLVIKSDATGTGSLITSSSPAATVERYISKYNTSLSYSARMFHYISSPVTAQAIQPEFVAATPATDADFYSFNETTNLWINTKTTGGSWNSSFESNFTPGKGYVVAYPADNTKYFTGNLNTYTIGSPLVMTCSKTSGQGEGWNLLGNPFTSAINWTAVKASNNNVDQALYYYDNSGASYRYYIKILDNSIGSGSPDIPAMQGFMVHASANNGTVTIQNSDRVHQAQTTFYKSSNTVPNSLSLKVAEAGYEDEMFVHFTLGATANFDGDYDAYKLDAAGNGMPIIYSTAADNTKLAINGLPELTENTVVPVNFSAGTDGECTITADLQNLTDAHVFLVDNKLTKVQNLSDNPVYTFTASTSDQPDRFKLTFGSVGIIEPQGAEHLQVYIDNGNLVVIGKTTTNAQIMVSNMLGQVVLRSQTNGNSLTKLNVNSIPNGVYVVSLVGNSKMVSEKIVVSK